MFFSDEAVFLAILGGSGLPAGTVEAGSLKMNTALEYSTRVVHGRGAVDVKRVLLTI